MKTIAVWKGLEAVSVENCRISKEPSGFLVESEVSGLDENRPFSCRYRIETNDVWEVVAFRVETVSGWQAKVFDLQKRGGQWRDESNVFPEFNHCHAIDISVTPFTNTLPVNNLRLKVGESRQIAVVYINVLAQTIGESKQIYTRLSPHRYRFENGYDDFKADIEVDDHGLVTHYEGLFERV